MRQFQLFSGTASQYLAKEIARHYGCQLGEIDLLRFSDGEMQPSFTISTRGNDVYLVQSNCPPAENLLELLLMMDAAKRSSAKAVTVVMPYFGYARQDRKDKPRVSIGAKLMANLLTAAGADRVVTMDLHAGQIQGFFDIPVDNLEATSIFIPYLQSLQLEDVTFASPDMGGVGRARTYAKHLKGDLVLVDKYRERANQVASMQLIGEVKGRNVIIVDDIIDTAGTLCRAADYIMEQGARSVRACVTHPILSGSAYERIEQSSLIEVVVSNTIPLKKECSKIKVLDIAPIFAEALKKIHNFESVSSLFLT
ncbi:MAG: ribose-phosphate pyrophosphokinase [Bacteroidetes bacterium]|nr:ribose-phosphate pyrophosphokinase [Bacteroidota bacterium]